jgi:hypothetical protein
MALTPAERRRRNAIMLLDMAMMMAATSADEQAGAQSGGVPTPSITLLTDSSDNTPEWSVSASFAVDDVVTMQLSTDNFGTIADTATATVTQINPVNTLTFDFGALADDTYQARAYITRATVDGGYSNTTEFTIAAGSAWTLSVPTASASGLGSVGATTDGTDGTLYAVLTTSATTPTDVQVENGQDHTGSAAALAKSVAVSSSGAKTITQLYGLAESTTYYAHLMHKAAGGARSNVVTSSSIATSNNLAQKTQLFGDAYWTATLLTVTANTATAPDGTTTADKVGASSTTNNVAREIYNTSAVTVSNGPNHTISVFIKPGVYTKAQLVINTGSSIVTWFDLTGSGSVLTQNAVAAGIDAVDNGFYRIWIRRFSTSTSLYLAVRLASADNTVNVTPAPAIGDGFEIWGAQIEQADSPTIYCAVS